MYASPQHLQLEDGELHRHVSTSWARHLEMASRDLELDLTRRGICVGEAYDAGARAVLTAQLLHHGEAPLLLPAGSRLVAKGCSAEAPLVFLTDDAVTLLPEEETLVEATAEAPGVPWNIDAGTRIRAELHDDVEGRARHAATFGRDHQLARGTVYRALELIYGDLSREEGDPFDHRRKIYARRYLDELDRLQQAGVLLKQGEEAGRRTHGAVRLLRG